MSRARYLAPNALTATNVACGFAALAVAVDGHFEASVYLLVLAIVLDSLDGAVARWLSATSRFGQEMDSFSDALSFGVAPAFLLYVVFLRPLGGWGLAVSLAYLLAAVLRLARFNLTSDVHVKDTLTVGVPTPIAASYVMAAVLIRDELPAGVMVAVGLAFAGLMVSRVRLPNLKGRNLVSSMLLVGIANYLLVVLLPSWYTIAWWNLWNVFILLAAHAQHRPEIDAPAPEVES